MAVPSVMNDLSTTASSNSPAGTDTIGTSMDDFLRAISAIIRTTNAKGSDIASATTTDIGAATGEFVDVTGTTTIIGLGTIGAGISRTVRFTGSLTLTYNASSLILPGNANIQTAAGDIAFFRSLGSGNWICVAYYPEAVAPSALSGARSIGSPVNLALDATNGTNALTIAIKTNTGNDPSVGDPVKIPYRSATDATGTYALRELTSAQSLTITSGATMGASDGVAFRLWVVWIDDGTDYSLGVINCYDSTNNDIYPLTADDIGLSATTMSASADSAQVLYADGSPSSSFVVRVLGYIEYTGGLTTAGTWDADPEVIQLYSPDVPLPGGILRTIRNVSSAYDSGTGTFAGLPTTALGSSSGNQFFSTTFTARSPANIIMAHHRGHYARDNSASSHYIASGLFRDAEGSAGAAVSGYMISGSNYILLDLVHRQISDNTSSTTWAIRTGAQTGSTKTSLNGTSSGTLFFGGTGVESFLDVIEIQG